MNMQPRRLQFKPYSGEMLPPLALAHSQGHARRKLSARSDFPKLDAHEVGDWERCLLVVCDPKAGNQGLQVSEQLH